MHIKLSVNAVRKTGYSFILLFGELNNTLWPKKGIGDQNADEFKCYNSIYRFPCILPSVYDSSMAGETLLNICGFSNLVSMF